MNSETPDSMKKNDFKEINKVEVPKFEIEESKHLVTTWFNLKAGWTNWLNASGNLDAETRFG
jgi:hypothetical protein